ncbi:hypothetical protein JX265_007539 [Neoarthrinium moseri]|uniref:Uncharacterized protein n=1 Tax=Neoarthrinium moseri TaxID=1658444 RepID=A0A9P9WJP1_9PEZI|nr:hypothetical protein JX265_007539 [Neoarthrinium moseri]
MLQGGKIDVTDITARSREAAWSQYYYPVNSVSARMDVTHDSFELEAPAGTDIWKKPPSTDVWNAPITRASSGLLQKFQSARVTFWADWTERYDQAGLLLALQRTSSTASPSPVEKWVKTGIEFYNGKPHLSTVGCDRWADWSILPLTEGKTEKGVTLEVVRESDENGKSAWIYQVILDGAGNVKEKLPLREICWIFADEDEKGGEEWVLDVSPLVARPEKSAKESLKARFDEFEVKWLV